MWPIQYQAKRPDTTADCSVSYKTTFVTDSWFLYLEGRHSGHVILFDKQGKRPVDRHLNSIKCGAAVLKITINQFIIWLVYKRWYAPK